MNDNSLNHGITELQLPIYISLSGGQCRPPGRLALGDSLMVLGLLRNYGKPVELFLDPLPALLPLLQAHPLIRDVLSPAINSNEQLNKIDLPRSGRQATWQAKNSFTLKVEKSSTIDQVKANPILAHSLYYKLPRQEDWPSIMLDPNAGQLASLLSSSRPNLLLFPVNPGRSDAWWHDDAWWAELLRRLKPHFHLIAAGAASYGMLGREVDALLPMNAPESTLMNLAWLAHKAHGFIGRDGGLSHLAAAVNSNIVTIWDSMASYRYWAGTRGHHIIMSNPSSFRFPQQVKVDFDFVLRNYQQIQHTDINGNLLTTQMPAEAAAYRQKAIALFGSLEHLYNLVLGDMEQKAERQAVKQWMLNQDLRRKFYQQSQDFCIRAISGGAPAGGNWVVPFSL